MANTSLAPRGEEGAAPPCILEVCTDERRDGLGRSKAPHRPTETEDCQGRGHERHVEVSSVRGSGVLRAVRRRHHRMAACQLGRAARGNRNGVRNAPWSPCWGRLCPLPFLDVLVPQTVDHPVDILKIIAKVTPAVEQVIDVPKIIQDPTPQRTELSDLSSWWNSWWKCRCRTWCFWYTAMMKLAYVGAGFTAKERSIGGCGAPRHVKWRTQERFIANLVLQLSLLFMIVSMPSDSVIDRVLDISVVPQRTGRHSANCAEGGWYGWWSALL